MKWISNRKRWQGRERNSSASLVRFLKTQINRKEAKTKQRQIVSLAIPILCWPDLSDRSNCSLPDSNRTDSCICQEHPRRPTVGYWLSRMFSLVLEVFSRNVRPDPTTDRQTMSYKRFSSLDFSRWLEHSSSISKTMNIDQVLCSTNNNVVRNRYHNIPMAVDLAVDNSTNMSNVCHQKDIRSCSIRRETNPNVCFLLFTLKTVVFTCSLKSANFWCFPTVSSSRRLFEDEETVVGRAERKIWSNSVWIDCSCRGEDNEGVICSGFSSIWPEFRSDKMKPVSSWFQQRG